MEDKIAKYRFKKYKRLENEVKERFKEDETPLQSFYGISYEFTLFFQKRGITNLGEYMKFIMNKSNHTTINHFCNRNNMAKKYKEFTDNILDYVNKKLVSAVVFCDKTNESVKEEHYEKLKALPKESFIKDSDSMKEISKKQEVYLKNLTEPLVKQNLPFEEIEKVIDSELYKFREIVEDKRQHAQLSSRVNSKIENGVKFKHAGFSHEEGHLQFNKTLIILEKN